MMDDKLAMSGTIVRKAGEGYYKGTWTDAWAYYFDASYNLNNNHRLQFYALGAPQQHMIQNMRSLLKIMIQMHWVKMVVNLLN
jgi:hypothetical protein